MSQHFFIACDGCKQEIKDGEGFVTRPKSTAPFNHPGAVGQDLVFLRRDLCDACALRIRQALISSGLEVDWLLSGFERGRHE
jgi:hypothetical protein